MSKAEQQGFLVPDELAEVLKSMKPGEVYYSEPVSIHVIHKTIEECAVARGVTLNKLRTAKARSGGSIQCVGRVRQPGF